jgi:hypothetical protein
VLVWQADTATMHPDLDPGIIAAAYAGDPVAAAAEYGGQFRSDLEGYLAREALDAAIVAGGTSCRRCPTCRTLPSPIRAGEAPLVSRSPSPTRTRPRAVCSSI